MTGKTHQILGITLGLTAFILIVEPKYSPATLAAVIVGSHLAALVPDFDQATAKIWDSIPLGGVVGRVVDPLVPHRHISHSILGVILFAWALTSLLSVAPDYWGLEKQAILITVLIAYCSHLIGDMVTVEGIPLLFPLNTKVGFPPWPFHGLRILTGKWFENLVVFPVFSLLLWVVVWMGWPVIKIVLFH